MLRRVVRVCQLVQLIHIIPLTLRSTALQLFYNPLTSNNFSTRFCLYSSHHTLKYSVRRIRQAMYV